jgi:hypothetical protein
LQSSSANAEVLKNKKQSTATHLISPPTLSCVRNELQTPTIKARTNVAS